MKNPSNCETSVSVSDFELFDEENEDSKHSSRRASQNPRQQNCDENKFATSGDDACNHKHHNHDHNLHFAQLNSPVISRTSPESLFELCLNKVRELRTRLEGLVYLPDELVKLILEGSSSDELKLVEAGNADIITTDYWDKVWESLCIKTMVSYINNRNVYI